jgi:AcrR family transcriptional regulator
VTGAGDAPRRRGSGKSGPAADPGTPRRRGRPRAGADPQGPLDEWIDGLSPTAIHIVEAGRRVLVADGYEAVTIERVAHEANVSPPTVRRLFVSKAGLLHAIFSRLEAEEWEKLVAEVKGIEPPAARLEACVRGLGRLISTADAGMGLTEARAQGGRDPILREKFAFDYDLARRGWLELGLDEAAAGAHDAHAGADDPAADPPADPATAVRLRALAGLIVATIDGMSLQVATDPAAVDLDATFAVLAEMVHDWLRGEGDRGT